VGNLTEEGAEDLLDLLRHFLSRVTGITIHRVADGKIVERWSLEDGVSLHQLLGALS
jgi:hypothetical protein